jgi:hypothetical protein
MTDDLMKRLPWIGLLALLAACTGGPDPAVVPLTGNAAPSRAAIAPGSPPGPGAVPTVPPPSAAMRDQAALAAACRADADRIVTFRDRGQLMREDERDARIGTDASIYARRSETDRLGRIYERDRLASNCVQENTRTAPQR